jgi:uncharacterized protein HemY
MSHSKNHLRASVVLVSLMSGVAGLAPLAVVAASKAAVENKDVADALLEAKRLAGKKQWDGALAAVRKAKAVDEKSAYADYKIDEFEAYVLTQQRKYSQAAEVFERLARSDNAPKQDVPRHWKTAAQLYLQSKAYAKASQSATQALKFDAGDIQLLELLAQSQYLGKDYRAAVGSLQKLTAASEKSGKQPKEEWLQMQLASYNQLKDEKGIATAWESLLEHYPKTQYWETVLAMKASKTDSEALEAGYRRLMFDVGVLKKPTDYEDLALNAIDAGAPSEAVKVLEAGLENGSLGGKNEARYRRMLEFAQTKVKEREQNLARLTAQGDSLPAESSLELGRLYLGRGDYEKAIEQLRRGLKAEGVNDEEQARIALGIAYLRNEQPNHARETFAAVNANSEWHDLAELWTLRATNE